MKSESKTKILDDNSFEYLLSVLHRDFEFARKYRERAWEIFKYYITIVTAVGGLFIGLISSGFSDNKLIALIPFSTGVLFVIGIMVFIQLLNMDLDHTRLQKRIQITTQCIERFTALNEYFEKISSTYSSNALYTYEDRYSIINVIKRSVTAPGIKTQLILINSSIGTLGIIFAVLNNQVTISIELQVLMGITVFIALLFFHGIYSSLKGKTIKYLDKIDVENKYKF